MNSATFLVTRLVLVNEHTVKSNVRAAAVTENVLLRIVVKFQAAKIVKFQSKIAEFQAKILSKCQPN